MTRFLIKHCPCTGLSFATVLQLAQEHRLAWEDLSRATQAGRLCKHCRPWLQRALDSGICIYEEDSSTLRNGEVLRRHFCPDTSD